MYTKIMYISARQKKKFVVFAIFLIFACVLAFVVFWLNREATEEFRRLSQPKGVVLSNVGEDGVAISWVTEVKTEGSLVVYDVSGEAIEEFKDVRNIGRSNTHYVEISGLKPNSTYEFEILSSEGDKRSFSTRSVLPENPIPNVLSGYVDATDVLVFLLTDDLSQNYPLSSSVVNGQWSFDLSEITPASGEGIFDLRGDTPLKLLFYSNDGVKVIQGNRNALFARDGQFNGTVKLDGSENIFLHVPDFAKFKGDFVEVESVASDVEREGVSEDILGVEEKEEVEETEELEVVEEIEQEKESSIQRMESVSDYGFR